MKFGPNLWQIWQVFGPCVSLYEENGQMIMTVQTTGLDNSKELRKEKICQVVTEIWVRLAASRRPPACLPTCPPTSLPGPWWQYPSSPVKSNIMKYYNCMFMLHASKYPQQAGFYGFCLNQTWNLICVHKIHPHISIQLFEFQLFLNVINFELDSKLLTWRT